MCYKKYLTIATKAHICLYVCPFMCKINGIRQLLNICMYVCMFVYICMYIYVFIYLFVLRTCYGQVNELWSFDLSTYTWEFLNTSLWCSVAPQPREQHSAVNIGGDVFIFGGKARPFNVSSDIVYGDIWKLSVEKVS